MRQVGLKLQEEEMGTHLREGGQSAGLCQWQYLDPELLDDGPGEPSRWCSCKH